MNKETKEKNEGNERLLLSGIYLIFGIQMGIYLSNPNSLHGILAFTATVATLMGFGMYLMLKDIMKGGDKQKW